MFVVFLGNICLFRVDCFFEFFVSKIYLIKFVEVYDYGSLEDVVGLWVRFVVEE